jgi:hypothetical protein
MTLPTVEADERVPKYPEEPGSEVGPRRELRGCPQRASIGLLDQILGIRRAPRQIPGQVVEGVGVGERLASQRRRFPTRLDPYGAHD